MVGENKNMVDVELINSEYRFKRENDKSRYSKKFDGFKLPKTLTEDLAYLIGFSYGDGSIEYDRFNEPESLTLAIEHKRPKIKEKIEQILNGFSLPYTIRKGDGALDKLLMGKKMCCFLLENGLLKQKSVDIIFPEKIINANKKTQISFIAGYFDADGDNAKKKGGYRFRSVNEKFLKNLQSILLMNGIISRISFEDRKPKKWLNLYSLVIVGKYSQSILLELIEDKSIKVLENKHISKRDNVLTPFSPNNLKFKGGKYKFIAANDENISINAFSQLNNEDKNNIAYPLFMDRIVSINDVGDSETFDLVLEKENLFYCEGFYVHNSGRRGALLESISIKHPSAETFIDAKMIEGKIAGANISVKIDDEFMSAVSNNSKYTQQFPIDANTPKISKDIDALTLWKKIIHNSWKLAEPGVLFWDTIIRESIPDCYADLGFKTSSVNPCGELILCASDSCRLLCINLYSYIDNPFSDNPSFNIELFKEHCRYGLRLMDDIVDLELEKIDKIISKVELDPEPDEIKYTEKHLWEKIKGKCLIGRRTGFGITAEGDMIAGMNLIYGTEEATKFASEVHRILKLSAYRESVELAKEREPFSIYDANREKNNPFIKRIKEQCKEYKLKNIHPEFQTLYEDMIKYGRRNIALLTIAPTGSLSLLTQTTSGIEPTFLISYKRRKKINPNDKGVRVDFIDEIGDSWQEFNVFHHKFEEYLKIKGYNIEEVKLMPIDKLEEIIKASPYHKATSNDVDWVKKIEMQGVIQQEVDHSISCTTNLPADATEELVNQVYLMGYKSGCKGLTVYRDGSRSGVLINRKEIRKEKHELEDHSAPKRPKILDAEVMRFVNNYEKWIAVVGLLDGRPYEIFTGKEEAFSIPASVTKGKVIRIKEKETEKSIYNFQFEDKDGYKITMEGLSRSFDKEYWNYAKLISGVLRHGMPIPYVIELVSGLNLGDDSLSSWKSGMTRALKKYIPNGTHAKNAKCPECGDPEGLLFTEGCITCKSCGFSKC